INGFKQHIAIDLDHKLILATTVRPANEPEHEATRWLKPKVEKYGTVESKSIDRGYLASDWTAELYAQGKRIVAKPWNPAAHGKYGKKDFSIDLHNSVVTCPAGKVQKITGNPGSFRAKFSVKVCGICPIKNSCSDSKTGRTIAIHDQEAMLQTLKYFVETPEGRNEARERVKVEHALASICNRKGPRARYFGLRLNEFDL
ncbi:transposase, partial [Legionella sp. PL877]|uniref:transposase n=1 Tax=Legionella sp. PL877 TaxID=3046773 RepID=UPI0024B80D62